MKLLAFTVFLFLSAGCGSGNNTGDDLPNDKGPVKVHSFDVDLEVLLVGKQLPECSSENEGKTYFQISDSSFVYCDTTGWTDISLKGDSGEEGANGDNGVNGQDGINTLVATATDPSGENCSNGGTKLFGGKDINSMTLLTRMKLVLLPIFVMGQMDRMALVLVH